MVHELVLVVDDEPDILRLCDRILSNEGYTVYTAGTGSHAVRIARETPLDVILVDLQMPDSDGMTIYKTIKGYQPDIIGIVITGYPSMEATINALRQGMSGFVLKPFTPNELREAVAHATERRRLDRDYSRLRALMPLYELSRSLITTTDIDVLLNQAVEMSLEETGADSASLMLEEDGELRIKAARGLADDFMDIMDTKVVAIGEGIAGWVARHGEPLLLDETVSMPPELADALTRDEIASAVCVPLTLQDRVIGVLNLSKFEPTDRPFTPSDRDLISVLAGQVAVAIQNARLFSRERALTRELSQANANLRALQQAATVITSRLSPERVLETIVDACTDVVNNATIAIGLLTTDKKGIEVHVHHGKTHQHETVELVLQPQELREIDAPSQAERVLNERLTALIVEQAQPASVGVIRLSAHDQLLGAMAVGAPQKLTEFDINTLAPFADQAAVAISNARLFTSLRHAYEKLLDLDQSRSEFINIAASELRSPLSVIKASSEILRKTAPENLQPELSRLQQAVDELEAHIQNLTQVRGLEAPRPAPSDPQASFD